MHSTPHPHPSSFLRARLPPGGDGSCDEIVHLDEIDRAGP